MGQVDWVMLLPWVGVVLVLYAVFVPFFLSLFNKMFNLSKQIEDAQRTYGEKLGEVLVELANIRTDLANVRTDLANGRTDLANARTEFGQKLGELQTDLANVRTDFGEKFREVQIGLSEDFADLRVDVARLEGILAGAGIGSADSANSGRNVSDSRSRTAAPIGDSRGAPARETPLAASSPRDG